MPNTHCLPNGSLGTGEVPVCHIGTDFLSQVIPAGGVGLGNIRGVVVLMNGLSLVPLTPPLQITDSTTLKFLTLANDLAADGWIVVMPPFNEEVVVANHPLFVSASNPASAIQTDITNDSGNGLRTATATWNWWDHVLQWIYTTYGRWPIVPFGVSWGGWHSWQIAIHRTSSIIAYGGHCGVTILTDLAAAATTPANWTGLTTTGANVTSTALNSMTIPGWIGWSTSDTAVGSADLIAMKAAAIGAGAPITTLQDNTNGHGLFLTDIGPGGSGFTGTTIMDWFTGTVDPLAPKAH